MPVTPHRPRRAALGLAAVAVLGACAAPSRGGQPDSAHARATATRANGQIAFRRFFDAKHRTGALFVINPDGAGERQITHPPAGAVDCQFGPPSFAPDGSKLIFSRSRAGTDALWTVNADGGGERRISPKPRYAHPGGRRINTQYGNAVYSPDGRRIAFVRADPPLRHNNLRVSLNTMAANGTRRHRLIDRGHDGDVGRVAWSPDGRRLVYEAAHFGRNVERALFVLAVRGGRPHRITPWRETEFNTLDWSPDGARLLIQRLPLNQDFGGDYSTIRPDGTGRHRLTHLGPGASNGSARWSPDGTSIVFATDGVGGNDDIYVMRADGSAITPVTRTPSWESAPAWGAAR